MSPGALRFPDDFPVNVSIPVPIGIYRIGAVTNFPVLWFLDEKNLLKKLEEKHCF